MMKLLHGLYDWTMEKAAHPHAVWWLAFFCFIESSFFPIPPHPLLGLMCLAEPKKAIRFSLVAVAASVAGALLGYGIGYFLFEAVGEPLVALLGLTEAMPAARCTFEEWGPAAVAVAGATPVPFKLLTITAGFLEMSLVPFILASIVGRAIIFLTVGVLFRLFGAPDQTGDRRISRHADHHFRRAADRRRIGPDTTGRRRGRSAGRGGCGVCAGRRCAAGIVAL